MDFTLKLDSGTRDLVFDDDGIMATIEGDDTYIQNVENNLNTWLGEFVLDDTHGTDYSRILGRNDSEIAPGEPEEVIRDAVLQEPNVSLINSVTVGQSARRTMDISLSGELLSGENISIGGITQRG